MKKVTLAAVVPLVLGLALPALAQGGRRDIQIAVIAKSRANPVFEAAHRGAQDAAQKLGAKHGVTIDIAILTPDREDPGLQLESIAKAYASFVDEKLERVNAQVVLAEEPILGQWVVA